MSTTIETKFWDRGRHYRIEVLGDARRVRVWLRCQRRWYVVASAPLSRGAPAGAFPSELRSVAADLLRGATGRQLAA